MPAESASADSTACGPGLWLPVFMLRNDFSNTSLLDCPLDDKDNTTIHDQGALASYKYDNLTDHSSIAIDGVATEVMRLYPTSDYLTGFQIGPYLQGDGTYQFSQTPTIKSSDTWTTGAFTEFGLQNGGPFSNYFRFRGGEVFGSTAVKYNTFVGEWLLEGHFEVGGLGKVWIGGIDTLLDSVPFQFSLAPELIVQYDQLTSGGHSYLIFNSSSEDLRVGPELVAKLWAKDNQFASLDNGLFKKFLNEAFISYTIHYDIYYYSKRN
jgi:hypothetical protein